jgi:hypothetical protein
MKKIIFASICMVAAAPLFGQIPRTPDGKPDLSGIWQALNTANVNIQDHVAQKGAPAGQGVVEGNEIPYQPWALAKKKDNYANRATLDPENKCYLPGVPRITYIGLPFQIFERSDLVTILYEHAHANRFIYTNGTPHPKGPIEWWLGDSRGHWDGDTLVVDSTNFSDKTNFRGPPATARQDIFSSPALHVIERFTRIDENTIVYRFTVDDPGTWTRPWSGELLMRKTKGPIFEYACHEGNYGLMDILAGARAAEKKSN